MRETFYILEDGSNANPRDVVTDEKGVLRHKGGVAVAIGDHGNPRSRGVDVDEKGDEIKQKAPAKDRQVKAGGDEKDPNYKTR